MQGHCAESEPGRPIPYLDRVALEFPELRILGGHIGVPWLNEMLSLVMKYPNVFIDTSAYKVSRYPSELVEYMRSNKRHRILFGSNHPFWPAGECIAGLDAISNLGVEAQSAFLGGQCTALIQARLTLSFSTEPPIRILEDVRCLGPLSASIRMWLW